MVVVEDITKGAGTAMEGAMAGLAVVAGRWMAATGPIGGIVAGLRRYPARKGESPVPSERYPLKVTSSSPKGAFPPVIPSRN